MHILIIIRRKFLRFKDRSVNAKEKNLNNLYRARAAHFKWVNTVKLLVSGLSIEKRSLPQPIIQDTEIGGWYYNQALQFSRFTSQQVLEEMEALLEKMFNYYTKIYTIYFNTKKSSFGGFFGKKDRGVSSNDVELASRYYEDIVKISDEFKSKLQTFERQLTALQEDEHAQITNFKMMDEETEKVKRVKQKKKEEEEGEVYSLRAR